MAAALEPGEWLALSEAPWHGESLAGRHIHVQAEQGFGDTIQFARYLPMLNARGGPVSFRSTRLY